MIDAIIIVGWRSDTGAYLVDSYPQGVEIDEQDLLNLFNLHRMAANGNMDNATPNFNFLKIAGYTLASWYSGFRTTKYLAKPDFCVALMLGEHGNPNAWETKLKAITYNLLSKLEDPDYPMFIGEMFQQINADQPIEPFPGFENFEEEEFAPKPAPPKPNKAAAKPTTPAPAKVDDDFSDLLALAESQSSSNLEPGVSDPFASTESSESSHEDPFGTSNPFGMEESSAETFSSPIPQPKPTPRASPSNFPSASTGNKGQELGSDINSIIQELQAIDKKMPPQPKTEDKDQLFGFLEKKVGFLEQKIAVLNKIIRGLQVKEVELKEKNELIAKLLALLS